jgi:MFS family permease
MSSTFRSLDIYNFRIWSIGSIASNIGTWMQRVAQDWLVLTQLTHQNATAVGIVTALQFGPQLLMLPFSGSSADRFDRRKLLIATQTLMGLLALGLGLLTIAGVVELWHVYCFAFGLGCVAAFDAPARQTFVSELVPDENLSNAVALNSTSFNAARLIGPAVAGVMINLVGTGWVFLFNAASFVAVLYSMTLLRKHELYLRERSHAARRGLGEGFRYVWRRPDLKAVLFMLFLIGTFGLNFPIFISTMAVGAFHVGPHEFGLLTSVMAIGSVSGALLSAKRAEPRVTTLFVAAALFGIGFVLAAFMPSYWWFALTLVWLGAAAQTFTTTANGTLQLSTEPEMRGRVMAIFLAVTLGSAPIGGPIVGYVADTFGPRWALGMGATAGLGAALVGLRYLIVHRGLRVHVDAGKLRIVLDDAPTRTTTV